MANLGRMRDGKLAAIRCATHSLPQGKPKPASGTDRSSRSSFSSFSRWRRGFRLNARSTSNIGTTATNTPGGPLQVGSLQANKPGRVPLHFDKVRSTIESSRLGTLVQGPGSTHRECINRAAATGRKFARISTNKGPFLSQSVVPWRTESERPQGVEPTR